MFEKLTEYLHRFIHNLIIELMIGGVGAVLGFFYGVAQWDGLEPVVFWATLGAIVGMTCAKAGRAIRAYHREVVGGWSKGKEILGLVAGFLVWVGGVFVLNWMNAYPSLTCVLPCFCGGFAVLLVHRYFDNLQVDYAAGRVH